MSVCTRPRIVVIETGGTIASEVNPLNSKEYSDSDKMIKELLCSDVVNNSEVEVIPVRVSSVGSQDMSEEIWHGLNEQIENVLDDSSVRGIVITHGTDTLEETALFLDLITAPGKPLVLTGAMRPRNDPYADGPLNLANAMRIALAPETRGRGVLVSLSGAVHAARDLRKMRTAGLNGFVSLPRGPLGAVNTSGVNYFGPPVAWSLRGAFRERARNRLPRVEIVYAHVGMNPGIVEFLLKEEVAGIVLAGVGDGNAPGEVLRALREAAAQGVAIVRSTRVPEGVVDSSVEVDDKRMGFVIARGFCPQKSRIILQLLVANGTPNTDEIQRAFDTW